MDALILNGYYKKTKNDSDPAIAQLDANWTEEHSDTKVAEIA